MTTDTEDLHRKLIDLLEPEKASAVLDLGCGRGDHLRMVAARTSEDAQFIGIDRSQPVLQAAREATGDPRLTYLSHDLRNGIPFEDCSFDRILSINSLEAFPDKQALLREAQRVLIPGGLIVCAHYDWESQLLDGDDKELVRRTLTAFSDWQQDWMAAADGWMGRRLWRTFQACGGFQGRVVPLIHTSTVFQAGTYGWERCRDIGGLVKRGAISDEDYNRFLENLKQLAARNEYFYSITMFSYVGSRSHE